MNNLRCLCVRSLLSSKSESDSNSDSYSNSDFDPSGLSFVSSIVKYMILVTHTNEDVTDGVAGGKWYDDPALA